MSEKEEKENYFSNQEKKEEKKGNHPEIEIGDDESKKKKEEDTVVGSDFVDSESQPFNDVHQDIKRQGYNPMKKRETNKKIIYIKMFVCLFILGSILFNTFFMTILLILNEHSAMSFAASHIFNILLPVIESVVFSFALIYLCYKLFKTNGMIKKMQNFFEDL